MPFDYPDDFPKASINAVELADMKARKELEAAMRKHSGPALESDFVRLIAEVTSAFVNKTLPLVKAGRWDLAEARTQAANFLHQVIVVEYYDHDGSARFPPLRFFEPLVTAKILHAEPWQTYENDLVQVVPASVKSPHRRASVSMVAADRVRDFLERTNTERTDFATSVGIDPRTLRQFLSTGKVRRTTLAKIAEKMGTDLQALCKP